MSLNSTPKITWTIPEYGVSVWIQAVLKHEGCDVSDIEGFALSHPGSADLMTVALCGPRDPITGKHVIGPEISAPWPSIGAKRHDPLTKILSELLWEEARKTETRRALQDAWEEAEAERANARSGNRYDQQRAMQDTAA